MILNPRVKLSIFDGDSWTEEDRLEYMNGCRIRFMHDYANTTRNTTCSPMVGISNSDAASPSVTVVVNKKRTSSAMENDKPYQAMVAKRSAKRRRNDYDRYIETPNDPSIPSLLWWRTFHTSFPDLARQARDCLAVPASGSSVERIFSISGRIATWERSRLKGETIANLMIYKAGLMRNNIALRELKIESEEDDLLPIPALEGTIPQEWAEKWWLEQTKYPIRKEIMELFPGRSQFE
jgi:hAT family C-terminal dimerisation region